MGYLFNVLITNVLIKIITTVGMTFVEAQPNLKEKILEMFETLSCTVESHSVKSRFCLVGAS